MWFANVLHHIDLLLKRDIASAYTSNLINSRREKDYLEGKEDDIERVSRLNKMNLRFTRVASAIFQR